MTRTSSARLAGFTYLLYIAVDFPALMLQNRANATNTAVDTLALIAQHTLDLRMASILGLLAAINALVLAVALYGVTRHDDSEIAAIGLVCRVGEGLLGTIPVFANLGLVWLVTQGNASIPHSSAAAFAAGFVKLRSLGTLVGSFLFSIGSTLFCSLLLRGRSVPVLLAWLGVIGSAILVIALPAQLGGWLAAAAAQFLWIPIAIFEILVAFYFLVRGVAQLPATRTVPATAAA